MASALADNLCLRWVETDATKNSRRGRWIYGGLAIRMSCVRGKSSQYGRVLSLLASLVLRSKASAIDRYGRPRQKANL